MALAQDDGFSQRYYSLSQTILDKKNEYYEILEKTQKSDGDITEWLLWFIGAVQSAVDTIRCHTTFRHPFNFSWSGKTCDIRRSSKTTS